MNRQSLLKSRPTNPVFNYLVLCFYSALIGYSGVAIWIKWDDVKYKNSLTDYSEHVYEEGFEAVAVTVPLPRSERKESFLSKLTRRTANRPQPLVREAADGRANWQKFAASAVLVPDGHAQVVLVIDDLGIVKDMTREMIDMDAPLTLSFLPYASGVAAQVEDAYAKNHDILVHIPMEPKGRADPGPHALMSSTSQKVQMDSIHYNLGQFSNYIGINNHMGSRFTEDDVAVDRLLSVVKDQGLMVLDSKTTPASKLEALANQKSIPVTNRDVFLDNVRDEGYILGQLAELERIAISEGSALAIGHPYPQTVRALKQWIPTLADKGITIVPISQTLKEKYASAQLAAAN